MLTRDPCVLTPAMYGPLLKDDLRLIDEENSIPSMCTVKDMIELKLPIRH